MHNFILGLKMFITANLVGIYLYLAHLFHPGSLLF